MILLSLISPWLNWLSFCAKCGNGSARKTCAFSPYHVVSHICQFLRLLILVQFNFSCRPSILNGVVQHAQQQSSVKIAHSHTLTHTIDCLSSYCPTIIRELSLEKWATSRATSLKVSFFFLVLCKHVCLPGCSVKQVNKTKTKVLDK